MNTTKTVYYLPGQGGHLHEGLGAALLEREIALEGREIQGEFKKADFATKISIVSHDLRSHHWNENALVIANSFGAYLFLHAQAELPPYIGRVLLLSPIVGEFGSEELQMGFIPPRAKKLFEMASAGSYPTPLDCQIHVGSEDWQSNPQTVSALGQCLGIPIHVVPGSGHMLDKKYVGNLLDRWL